MVRMRAISPGPVKEPEFEGEPMRLPENVEYSDPAASTGGVPLGIISLLLACLVAIIGGLGYWYYVVMTMPIEGPARATRPSVEMNNEPESTTAEARTNAAGIVSTSDEPDALLSDTESTPEINNLTPEIILIENELNAGATE